MKESRAFAGFVDSWDGRIAGGWAVDRSRPDVPCDVDLYDDGQFVLRVRADLERPDLREVSPTDQRKGFRLEVPSNTRSSSCLELRFGGTTERIPTTVELAARPWRPRIDLSSPFKGGSSRWVPIPSPALITHITGQTGAEADLQRMYRNTGFELAGDIYNIALDLGADPHRRDYSILDLGCGCGRIATYLAQWLDGSQFLGVDIWRVGIDWAREKITAAYPTYRFHCSIAGEKGYESGKHYRIPAEDAKIDYLISTSLFTHLDVAACDGYLREMGRILKPGGLAYVTFFFRDERSVAAAEKMARAANLPLTKEPDAWFYGREGYVDIFHDQRRVLAVAAEAGLSPALHRAGAWRGSAYWNINPVAFQDLIVFQKS